jgi:hypothetical protein
MRIVTAGAVNGRDERPTLERIDDCSSGQDALATLIVGLGPDPAPAAHLRPWAEDVCYPVAASTAAGDRRLGASSAHDEQSSTRTVPNNGRLCIYQDTLGLKGLEHTRI